MDAKNTNTAATSVKKESYVSVAAALAKEIVAEFKIEKNRPAVFQKVLSTYRKHSTATDAITQVKDAAKYIKEHKDEFMKDYMAAVDAAEEARKAKAAEKKNEPKEKKTRKSKKTEEKEDGEEKPKKKTTRSKKVVEKKEDDKKEDDKKEDVKDDKKEDKKDEVKPDNVKNDNIEGDAKTKRKIVRKSKVEKTDENVEEKKDNKN